MVRLTLLLMRTANSLSTFGVQAMTFFTAWRSIHPVGPSWSVTQVETSLSPEFSATPSRYSITTATAKRMFLFTGHQTITGTCRAALILSSRIIILELRVIFLHRPTLMAMARQTLLSSGLQVVTGGIRAASQACSRECTGEATVTS